MSKFNYKLSDLFQDVDLNLIQCLIIEAIVASKFGGGQKEVDNAIFLCDGCVRMGLPLSTPSEMDLFNLKKFTNQFNDVDLISYISLAFYGEYKQLIIELK